MSIFKRKSIGVWFCINKNGHLMLFLDQPKRDKVNEIWIGLHPFVNSVLYKQIESLVEKVSMAWEKDPEYIEFQIQ